MANYEDFISLYDSQICRLCAEENTNGSFIYNTEESEVDISVYINRYLPIKIMDDAKLPRWICPGCNLQVESTVQFFDLIIVGQAKLRELLQQEKDQRKLLQLSEYSEEQHNKEIDFEIETPNTLLDGLLYPMDHEISLRIEGLDKPRKKRGRPPKPSPEALAQKKALLEEETQRKEEELARTSDNEDSEKRKKRRIKIPSRFQEAVQGKELERIYVAEGVIDKTDVSDVEDQANGNEFGNELGYRDEIIGHLQNTDGFILSDLVITNCNTTKTKGKRKTKFMCDICNKGFIHQFRFLAHRASHQNVRFECTQCLVSFSNRNDLIQHQKDTLHSGEGIVETLTEATSTNNFNELNAIDDSGMESLNDINAVEEAAKVLYDLQNNDKIDNFTSHKSTNIFQNVANDENTKIIVTQNSDKMNNKTENGMNLSNLDDGNENSTCTNDMLQQINEVNMSEMNEENEFMFNIPELSGSAFSTDNSVVNNTKKENNITIENVEPNIGNISNKIEVNMTMGHNEQAISKLPVVELVLDRRKHECGICKESFLYLNDLKNHIATHKKPSNIDLSHLNLGDDKRYSCEICNKQFTDPTVVIYHKECVHKNNRKFVCSKCDKTFKHKQLLQKHQMVHSNDRPFGCDVCGNRFKTKSHLQSHNKAHTGEKKFSCNLCGQVFPYKNSLSLHYKWHIGYRPFKCQYCDKTFIQNGILQEHLRIHTGERPYKCSLCDKKFKTNSQCKIHYKRHIGERPWKCDKCGREFLNLDSFKVHLRRHNSEKIFKCSLCTKGFAEHYALKKHVRSHTGERPYQCLQCGRCFSDPSNFKKHGNTHKLEDYAPGVVIRKYVNQLVKIQPQIVTNSDNVIVTDKKEQNILNSFTTRILVDDLPNDEPDMDGVDGENNSILPNSSATTVWEVFNNVDNLKENTNKNQIIYVTYDAEIQQQTSEDQDQPFIDNGSKQFEIIDPNVLSIKDKNPTGINQTTTENLIKILESKGDEEIFITSNLDNAANNYIYENENENMSLQLNGADGLDADVLMDQESLDDQPIEFVTEDGKKIKLLTNYSDFIEYA